MAATGVTLLLCLLLTPFPCAQLLLWSNQEEIIVAVKPKEEEGKGAKIFAELLVFRMEGRGRLF